eukprot:SAG25_NODE_1434_length_3030_cov_2.096213_3_plen_303_part_00
MQAPALGAALDATIAPQLQVAREPLARVLHDAGARLRSDGGVGVGGVGAAAGDGGGGGGGALIALEAEALRGSVAAQLGEQAALDTLLQLPALRRLALAVAAQVRRRREGGCQGARSSPAPVCQQLAAAPPHGTPLTPRSDRLNDAPCPPFASHGASIMLVDCLAQAAPAGGGGALASPAAELQLQPTPTLDDGSQMHASSPQRAVAGNGSYVCTYEAVHERWRDYLHVSVDGTDTSRGGTFFRGRLGGRKRSSPRRPRSGLLCIPNEPPCSRSASVCRRCGPGPRRTIDTHRVLAAQSAVA